MPTFALAATGAGLISAALHSALLAGSFGAIILAYLAQLPLFLAGLWIGFAGGALAAVVALVVLAAAGGILFALVYFVVNAAPAVAITYLAQLNRTGADGRTEYLPAGELVGWLTGFAASLFLLVVLTMSGAPGGAEGALRSFVETGLRQFPITWTDATSMDNAATTIARILPGVIAASWMAMVIVNSSIAQGLLVRFGRNFRPSPSMSDIVLPDWMQGALVISAIGAFFPDTAGFVGSNLVLIFTLAFALAGLGVVHTIAGRFTSRNLILVGIYAFVMLFGWPAVLLALLGIAEPWLNLRRRYGGGSGT